MARSAISGPVSTGNCALRRDIAIPGTQRQLPRGFPTSGLTTTQDLREKTLRDYGVQVSCALHGNVVGRCGWEVCEASDLSRRWGQLGPRPGIGTVNDCLEKTPKIRDADSDTPQHHGHQPQSCLDASSAPLTMFLYFSHAAVACPRIPQSVPACTFSLPTTLANCMSWSAMTSGGSTTLVV